MNTAVAVTKGASFDMRAVLVGYDSYARYGDYLSTAHCVTR